MIHINVDLETQTIAVSGSDGFVYLESRKSTLEVIFYLTDIARADDEVYKGELPSGLFDKIVQNKNKYFTISPTRDLMGYEFEVVE